MGHTKTLISIFLYASSPDRLIGVTNIFNTIGTNVALRRREFAMLRSVGLTPRGFNKIINYEHLLWTEGFALRSAGEHADHLLDVNGFGRMFDFSFFCR